MSEFDKKISALTSGTDSTATDEYVIARGGSNFKISGALVAAAATKVGTLASLAVTGDLTVDTDTLKVDAANNRVGIGTASPEAQLVVSKATSAGEGGYIYIDNPVASATGNKAGIKFATSSGGSFATFPTGEITNVLTNSGDGASALTFGTFDGSASAERMRIDASGNVGIGVTPSARFDVLAGSDGVGIRMRENASNLATIQITDNPVTVARVSLGWTNSTTTAALGTTGLLSFQTAGTERARIGATGVFRVGTSNDAYSNYATKKTTVGTGATTIGFLAAGFGQLVMVTGIESPPGNIYSDLLFVSSTSGATVLSAKTVSGSPASRTYTVSGSDELQLAMGSDSYDTRCVQITSV